MGSSSKEEPTVTRALTVAGRNVRVGAESKIRYGASYFKGDRCIVPANREVKLEILAQEE